MQDELDVEWLYELLRAFDELITAARAITDPDDEDERTAAFWEANLDNLSDAVNIANAAGADVPNIQEWIAKITNAHDSHKTD